ncbi:S1 RNA-binding domain-containing protein [Klebsiella pneumoniae]
MILEGAVTNVTNFGAFVDIGVHQDGLVHISSLSDRFVEDPHTVVKAGDIVKVKVMEVDLPRKRIAPDHASRRAAGRQQRPPRRWSGAPAGKSPSCESRQTPRSRGAACRQQRDDGCPRRSDG